MRVVHKRKKTMKSKNLIISIGLAIIVSANTEAFALFGSKPTCNGLVPETYSTDITKDIAGCVWVRKEECKCDSPEGQNTMTSHCETDSGNVKKYSYSKAEKKTVNFKVAVNSEGAEISGTCSSEPTGTCDTCVWGSPDESTVSGQTCKTPDCKKPA